MRPCVRPSADQREKLQPRNLHKMYISGSLMAGGLGEGGRAQGVGCLHLLTPPAPRASPPCPAWPMENSVPSLGPLHAAVTGPAALEVAGTGVGIGAAPALRLCPHWLPPRPALTGPVLAAVLCQLRPGGPERVHRLPQGQLLLHLLPAQGRLLPMGGVEWGGAAHRGLGPCGQRPSPGPLCLFPPFGLPSKEVKRVFPRGLEAASPAPPALSSACLGISM